MSSDFTESETSSSSNTSHGPGLNMSVEIVREVTFSEASELGRGAADMINAE